MPCDRNSDGVSRIGAVFFAILLNSRNQVRNLARLFMPYVPVQRRQIMQARRTELVLPVVACLAASASAMGQPVQMITPPTAQAGPSTVIIAPGAPPPPRVEAIPPPPTPEAQLMYWRQGHWSWTGVNWEWVPGQYTQKPAPHAIWEPGHWAQQPSGGYVWVDGRWQG